MKKRHVLLLGGRLSGRVSEVDKVLLIAVGKHFDRFYCIQARVNQSFFFGFRGPPPLIRVQRAQRPLIE